MDLTVQEQNDGKQIQQVLRYSVKFRADVCDNRVPNLIGRQEAVASPVWVAMHHSTAGVRLIQAAHQGAVDAILIYEVAYYDIGGNKNQPIVISSMLFKSCFITFADISTVPGADIFRFSFVSVTARVTDYLQNSSEGIHRPCGSYVYSFDYNAASGVRGDSPTT
jgi:hypothetical protein